MRWQMTSVPASKLSRRRPTAKRCKTSSRRSGRPHNFRHWPISSPAASLTDPPADPPTNSREPPVLAVGVGRRADGGHPRAGGIAERGVEQGLLTGEGAVEHAHERGDVLA